MMSGRVTICVLAGVLAAGLAAAPAAAKEGVEATLLTPVPLGAKPGTQIKVAWKLSFAKGEERGQPFGANGVFVRLRGPSGDVERGFAPSGSYTDGKYAATVLVPDGGIADIQVGLQGWSDSGGVSHEADLIFPITNDPMPGPARITSPPPDESGNSRQWILGVVLAVLLAAGVLVSTNRRARQRAPQLP